MTSIVCRQHTCTLGTHMHRIMSDAYASSGRACYSALQGLRDRQVSTFCTLYARVSSFSYRTLSSVGMTNCANLGRSCSLGYFQLGTHSLQCCHSALSSLTKYSKTVSPSSLCSRWQNAYVMDVQQVTLQNRPRMLKPSVLARNNTAIKDAAASSS